MGLFGGLFNSSNPSAKPAVAAPVTVPASLPKNPPPTAAKVCEEYNPESPAKELLTPQQTPSQYLEQVQKQQLTEETGGTRWNTDKRPGTTPSFLPAMVGQVGSHWQILR